MHKTRDIHDILTHSCNTTTNTRAHLESTYVEDKNTADITISQDVELDKHDHMWWICTQPGPHQDHYKAAWQGNGDMEPWEARKQSSTT